MTAALTLPGSLAETLSHLLTLARPDRPQTARLTGVPERAAAAAALWHLGPAALRRALLVAPTIADLSVVRYTLAAHDEDVTLDGLRTLTFPELAVVGVPEDVDTLLVLNEAELGDAQLAQLTRLPARLRLTFTADACGDAQAPFGAAVVLRGEVLA